MSDYIITVKPSAQKQLNSLPIEISSRMAPRIRALATDPRPDGCLKLKGKQNQWRMRVGDYRIIYSIDDVNFAIEILKVRHRREVYER
jgi:mRNA interferase RelE/StbE